MLYVYYGTDEVAARSAALAALGKKEVVRVEGRDYVEGQLLSLAEGNSLFGGTSAYLLDTPSDNQSFFDAVLDNAEQLSESPHLFVVVDKALLAADKKILSKSVGEIVEFKKVATATFNQFALTDALAARDKRQLWLLLQESWQHGSATEEIIGILWWQLKTMRLAALTKTATEAGMKDFPYRKAKSALSVFPLALVEEKSLSLTKLYHDARWGKGSMDQLLEMWVLSL